MLELIFVLGFFFMLLLTGISVFGVLAALFVAVLLMFVGSLFVMMLKLLPWLLLAAIVAGGIRMMKKKNDPYARYGLVLERHGRRYNRGRY